MARHGWRPSAAVRSPVARAPIRGLQPSAKTAWTAPRSLPAHRLPLPSTMGISEAPRLTLSHTEHPLRTHPTLDTLQGLTLLGMAPALLEQTQRPERTAFGCAERLGLLVERAITAREDRRLKTRLHKAKLRQTAWVADSAYRHPRGLEKARMLRCATWPWVRERHNVLITGPTGLGTPWLACALGHPACREGGTVLSLRLPRLLQALPLAQGAGRSVQLLMALAKTDVLMLDAWGLAPRSDDHRRDLLALREERPDCRATIVTSQLPVEHWHAALGEPTLADARLDRLVHNAYNLALQGDSMRKRQATGPKQAPARSGRHAQRRVAPSRPRRCGTAWLSWGLAWMGNASAAPVATLRTRGPPRRAPGSH